MKQDAAAMGVDVDAVRIKPGLSGKETGRSGVQSR